MLLWPHAATACKQKQIFSDGQPARDTLAKPESFADSTSKT
jgi:hypothetical protein